MSARTDMSLRHAKHDRFEVVQPVGEDGLCVIRDAAGRTANVKAAWLEFEGTTCWPGSLRKSIHIKSAAWTA